MRKDNFRDSVTLETCRINQYHSKIKNGEPVYQDRKGNQLVSEKGNLLEPIPYEGKVEAPSIKTPTKNRV